MRAKTLKTILVTAGITTLLAACGQKELNKENLIQAFADNGIKNVEIFNEPAPPKDVAKGFDNLYQIKIPYGKNFVGVVSCKTEDACKVAYGESEPEYLATKKMTDLIGGSSTLKMAKSGKAVFFGGGSSKTLAETINKVADEF